MKKIKIATKRLLIQCTFFLLQNPLLKNFATGQIYQGDFKKICTPGLNCYSCPAAALSCPIGSMQLFLAGARHSISLYVSGFLLVTGVVFGRLICGYVCPMGLLQDLIYKIKVPKLKTRFRYARYLKYAILGFFVVLLPFAVRHELTGLGTPWFCEYICPSGTIFAAIPLLRANDFLTTMIGTRFVLKAAIAGGILIVSAFIFRFFCRVLCPLGAIYALFNRFALFRMHCSRDKCVSCGKCAEACHIKLNPAANANSPECVRCGKCSGVCEAKAISYRKP
ncbi:MAG: 4Fe-4S binding protein [Oscillospiraceae bacterium]|nr:4Fe-4S binding protein [Oscillospiraceae bacterium]